MIWVKKSLVEKKQDERKQHKGKHEESFPAAKRCGGAVQFNWCCQECWEHSAFCVWVCVCVCVRARRREVSGWGHAIQASPLGQPHTHTCTPTGAGARLRAEETLRLCAVNGRLLPLYVLHRDGLIMTDLNCAALVVCVWITGKGKRKRDRGRVTGRTAKKQHHVRSSVACSFSVCLCVCGHAPFYRIAVRINRMFPSLLRGYIVKEPSSVSRKAPVGLCNNSLKLQVLHVCMEFACLVST